MKWSSCYPRLIEEEIKFVLGNMSMNIDGSIILNKEKQP